MEKKKNRSIDYHRTKYNDLEKAFADEWENANKECPFINRGHGILQDLFLTPIDGQPKQVTDEERVAAATAIQWLGTNCGFSFLIKVFQKCNYEIVEKQIIMKNRLQQMIDQESFSKTTIEKLWVILKDNEESS